MKPTACINCGRCVSMSVRSRIVPSRLADMSQNAMIRRRVLKYGMVLECVECGSAAVIYVRAKRPLSTGISRSMRKTASCRQKKKKNREEEVNEL
ncbi:MAG: hypothetical protein ACLU80_04320 [Dorea sp.]